MAACVLIGSLLSPQAYAFDVQSTDINLQDVQVIEYQEYDILEAIFSLFNGGTQPAQLIGHSMLYLNDTNADTWEYSSYLDLSESTETDCPILNATINSGQSANINLCFLIPKDNSTGYSIVANNDKYFMDMDAKEFVLESIPDWFKSTAGDWCSDIITESDFTNSTQSYIQDDTINVLRGQNGTDTGAQTPAWVKNNACQWSNSQISDYEFLDGIYWLIDNGKIQL